MFVIKLPLKRTITLTLNIHQAVRRRRGSLLLLAHGAAAGVGERGAGGGGGEGGAAKAGHRGVATHGGDVRQLTPRKSPRRERI